MREGWDEKTLVEVCDAIFAGGDVPKNALSKVKTEDYSVPIFANGATDKGLYGYTNKPRVTSPSITISARGTIGYSEIRREPFLPVVRLIVATPNTDVVTLEMLKYCIESMDFQNSGTSIPQLTVPMVKKYKLPIPPLEEQKQIVALLDKAFEAIDKAKANIEQNIINARELLQSKLNEKKKQKGEGWEEKTIGELGKPSMCKRILKSQTLSEGDIPFYKIGTFGKTANAYISKELYEEYKTKYSFPKVGDVLISASGTIGRRVIYDGEPAFFQDSNIVWIANDESLVSNDYLYQFYGVCDWNPSKGATISRLYNADLKRIKISYPSLEIQQVLVVKMVALNDYKDKLVNSYSVQLSNLEELKKSILQKAFTGELTAQDVAV